MTTTVVFGNTNDTYVASIGSTYSAALNGPGDGVQPANDGLLFWGQKLEGGDYTVWQAFMEFGYTPPANTKPVSAYFKLSGVSVTGTGVSRGTEIQAFNYGGTVDVNDWRTPAQLALSHNNRWANLGNTQNVSTLTMRPGIPELNRVDSSSTARFVVNSTRNRLQNAPTGQEFQSVRSADFTGTGSDPTLYVTAVQDHLLNRGIGAQVQLSDGSHFLINWTSVTLGSDSCNHIHRTQAGVSTTIHAETSQTNPRRGAQAYAMARDASDNVYVVNQSSTFNALNCRVHVKGIGNSWSTRDIVVGTLPTYEGTVNNVAMTWHPQGGTYGTLVAVVSHVAASNTGTAIAYVLINCDHLINGSGSLFRGVGNAEGLLVAATSVDGFNNFANETGTLLDVTQASVGSDRGFIQSTARHHVLTANSGPSLCRYTLNPTGTGFTQVWNIQETHSGYSTKDADAKSRVLPVSDSQFVTVTASVSTNFGLTVKHRQNIGESGSFNVLADVRLGGEGLATMPAPSVLATSQAWDAIYNPLDNRVWVYYFDTANGRRLMRTHVDLSTGQAGRDEIVVNATVGATGSTNIAIRVHRHHTAGDQMLVCVGNKTSGGTHSVVFVHDTINMPPTQPTLNPRANFNATTTALFSWLFNDPNVPSGDSQTAYRLQIDNATTFASAWDTGKVTSGTSNYTLPASALTNEQDWRWRVMTWDEGDLPSPWSEYGFFQTSASGVLNITDPSVDNDPDIVTASYLVTWSVTGSVQDAYRVVVTRTDTGATLINTGWVTSVDTQFLVEGMLSDVEWNVAITARNAALVQTNTANRKITPDYNAPEVPIISFDINDEGGYIGLNITNPEPVGDRPNPSTNIIHRRVYSPTTPDGKFEVLGETVENGTFKDYTAASGVVYEYRIRAIAGEYLTDSTVTAINTALGLQGIWLHDPLDPEMTARNFLFGKDNRTTDIDTKGTIQVFAGRRFPVVDFGEHQEDDFSIQVDIPHGPTYLTERQTLTSFMESKTTLVLRDNRSRAAYGTMSGFSESDRAWGSQVNFKFSRVSFTVEEV